MSHHCYDPLVRADAADLLLKHGILAVTVIEQELEAHIAAGAPTTALHLDRVRRVLTSMQDKPAP